MPVSIHDLSRSTGEGGDNLARFNMPLELGMAAALKFEREGSSMPHRGLALVPTGHADQRFISDLSGFDPARHDSSVPSMIRDASAWLRTLEQGEGPASSALRIHEAFPSVVAQANLRTAALDKETWADLVLAASDRCAARAE